jgi:hypothetical protein
MALADPIQPFVEHLRRLPYVKEARLKENRIRSHDALLDIRTRKGSFALAVELKRAYLDRTGTNALIALAVHEKTPLMVFARYIPRPTGERLATAGINFVDEAGNIHLRLGDDYHTLLLGKHQDRPEPEEKRISAAAVQMFFAFLARPETIQWPARRLAETAGVSKTAASDARRRLVAEGILRRQSARGYQLAAASQLEERFLQGYSRILRPHLRLGRVRARDRDPEAFVERLSAVAKRHNLQWALTGGAGAYELDPFYRGEETPVFLSSYGQVLQRELMLLPDRQGPITLLRLFGPQVIWAGATRRPIADPWLLYAELLQGSDDRALEAAKEIRNKYLHHEHTVA